VGRPWPLALLRSKGLYKTHTGIQQRQDRPDRKAETPSITCQAAAVRSAQSIALSADLAVLHERKHKHIQIQLVRPSSINPKILPLWRFPVRFFPSFVFFHFSFFEHFSFGMDGRSFYGVSHRALNLFMETRKKKGRKQAGRDQGWTED
jgi:hypothetical protein